MPASRSTERARSGQSERLPLPARLCSDDIVLRPWSAADRESIDAIVRASRHEFDDWLPTLAPSFDDFDAFRRVTAGEWEATLLVKSGKTAARSCRVVLATGKATIK